MMSGMNERTIVSIGNGSHTFDAQTITAVYPGSGSRWGVCVHISGIVVFVEAASEKQATEWVALVSNAIHGGRAGGERRSFMSGFATGQYAAGWAAGVRACLDDRDSAAAELERMPAWASGDVNRSPTDA